MNSLRRRAVIFGLCATVLVAVVMTVLFSGHGGGERHRSLPSTAHTGRRVAAGTTTHPRVQPPPGTRTVTGSRPRPAVRWQVGAIRTARTFTTWFDRWLAGEATAGQAPDVTPGYAAKLRTTVNNVPPAASGHVATIVHLIPAAMPPRSADPREAWIYTATRSQGAVIQFTVQERLTAGRWLIYGVYQGP